VLELAKAVDPDAIDRPRHTVDETEPSKETKSVQRLFEGAANEMKLYLESSTVADAIEERVKHRQTASVEPARSRSVWDDAASHSATAA
jgi:DNA-binding IscR family transcriptional regulator